MIKLVPIWCLPEASDLQVTSKRTGGKKVVDFDFFDYTSPTPEEAIDTIASLQSLLGEQEEAPKEESKKVPARRGKDRRISRMTVSIATKNASVLSSRILGTLLICLAGIS